MTLALMITRHAKSSWHDQFADDHSRPLNKRGRESAAVIGRWMQTRGYGPDLVLCSSAARTKETWAVISEEITAAPEVRFEGALYLATPQQMLDCLKSAGQTPCVQLIAHNPGSAMMAAALVSDTPTHPQFERYPTAATSVIVFAADDWSDVDWGDGQLIEFVVPRDLAASV